MKDGVANGAVQFFQVEGLSEKEKTSPGHQIVHSTISGEPAHKDHSNPRVHLLDLLKTAGTAHIGHNQIENHQVDL